MTRPTLALLVGAALCLPVRPVLAQQVQPGQRVRVSAPSLRPGWMTGQVGGRDSASLLMRIEGDSIDTSISLGAIRALERSAGTVEKADALWLSWGLMGAATVAGAWFGASADSCDSSVEQVLCGIGGAVVFNLGLSVALGPIWPTHPEEKWEPVPLGPAAP